MSDDIRIDSDALASVSSQLQQAAATLQSQKGKLGSAVPGNAFGPLLAFVPPGLNGVGGAMEGLADFVAGIAEQAGAGARAAAQSFADLEDDATSRFTGLDGGTAS